MHTTPLVTLEPEGPSRGRATSLRAAKPLGSIVASDGIGLAFGERMLRTLALALACVFVAAPPALANKRHAAAHGRAHAAHAAHAATKSKRPKPLVRVQKSAPPTRVAAVEQHAPPSPAPSPLIEQHAMPAPSPPVGHAPLGPQASDDEVPGSRMKR
jgi:hypothetical protein